MTLLLSSCRALSSSSRLLLRPLSSFTDQTQSASRKFSTAPAVSESDEFLNNAITCGYTQLEAFLTQGGDDRSLISVETGTNKYHIMPRPIASDAIFRGSCTCNAPTERGYQAASRLYQEKIEPSTNIDSTLKEIFQNQRERIAACLELPEGTEVVLCPSGSDAEYIPIVIARQLLQNPSKPLVNYITQLKEIGAGSNIASGGLYFSTHAPLTGRLNEDDAKQGLVGFTNLEEISIPARKRNGNVVNGSKTVTDMIAASKDSYSLIHGVFGGKTGLRDDIMPGSTSDHMGIIDACQGRFSLEELHGWLANESVVLFTGSKFYQAPPFCGAVFIPKNMAKQLSSLPAPEPRKMFESLSGFVTDKELSPCLSSWIPFLQDPNRNNVGLALRWEAGLVGMEALSNTPDHRRIAAVEAWAQQVSAMVQAEPELNAWCIERSIISIRLKAEGGWRSMSELRDIYRLMSMDLSSVKLPASQEEKKALAIAVNLGQPVDVADSHAILRIALGSESLSSFIDNPSATLAEDQTAVKKLATVAKYYDDIVESGI